MRFSFYKKTSKLRGRYESSRDSIYLHIFSHFEIVAVKSDRLVPAITITMVDSAPKSSIIPVEPAQPGFSPTRILYLPSATLLSTSLRCIELTGLVQSVYEDEGFYKTAWTAAYKAESTLSPCLVAMRDNPLRTHFKFFTEPGHHNVATWTNSGLQRCPHFTFTSGSAHYSHPIDLQRQGFFRYSYSFVQNSIRYEWRYRETFSGGGGISLFRIIGSQEILVAKLVLPSGIKRLYQMGRVLLINEREIDWVLAAVTALGAIRMERVARATA